MRSDLAPWVPPDLAVADHGFDVVVHFYGAPENQRKNATEAGLRAAFVSANEGLGSTPYARAFAAPGSLDRALEAATAAVRASGVAARRSARSSRTGSSRATRIPTRRRPSARRSSRSSASHGAPLPASEVDVYALDQRDLHVRGSAAKGPADHVAELQALDRRHALLARRWRH